MGFLIWCQYIFEGMLESGIQGFVTRGSAQRGIFPSVKFVVKSCWHHRLVLLSTALPSLSSPGLDMLCGCCGIGSFSVVD